MMRIIKGSGVILLFKILGAASLLLVHIIISRYYGVEKLGVFNLILGLMMIASMFSRLGLDLYVIRVIPALENDSRKLQLFLKQVFKILFVGAVIAGTLIFLLSGILNNYIFKSSDALSYIVWLSLIIIPFSLFSVLPEVLRAFGKISAYAFYRNLSQNLFILLLLIPGVLSLIKFDPVYVLYFSLTLIALLLSFVTLRLLKEKELNLFEKGRYRDAIVPNSYPMMLTASMMAVMAYVDSFMISFYMSEYEVGIYAACIKISLPIMFLLSSVSNYILPLISKNHKAKNYKEIVKLYRDSVKIVIFGSLPVVLFILTFPSFFLGIFGDEFRSYTHVLYVTILMNVLSVLIGPAINILNMLDMQSYAKNILFVGLLVNVVLNAYFIPAFGLVGAATATLISTFIWKMLAFLRLKKGLKELDAFNK